MKPRQVEVSSGGGLGGERGQPLRPARGDEGLARTLEELPRWVSRHLPRGPAFGELGHLDGGAYGPERASSNLRRYVLDLEVAGSSLIGERFQVCVFE